MDLAFLTIPNTLTFSRILLAPLFAFFYFQNNVALSWGCLVAAGLTDWLDGFLARALGQSSSFGEMLDPIADKVFLGGLLLCFYVDRRISAWVFFVVVARDLILLLGGLWAHYQGIQLTITPHFSSKLNTTLLFILGILVLKPLSLWVPSIWVRLMEGMILALTLFSGSIYVQRFIRACCQ